MTHITEYALWSHLCIRSYLTSVPISIFSVLGSYSIDFQRAPVFGPAMDKSMLTEQSFFHFALSTDLETFHG